MKWRDTVERFVEFAGRVMQGIFGGFDEDIFIK